MNYEPYYSEGWKNNEDGGTPITAASLNHVDDGLLDHDEDLQNIFGDIATMEESDTASQSYTVGDYLILDGLLYKVTIAISSGGTIAPGTNCEQTTVAAELDELNSNINAICIRERRATTATFNNANYGVAEVDISKSGYTPLGVVGFQAGGNSVLYRVSAVSFKTSTTISMTVVNQSGAAETSTQTGWIDVLYRKNLT